MFVAGHFFISIATVADIVLSAYTWILIISALISWVNPDPYNPVVKFLYLATEPVLRPIRRKIGTLGGIDISPVIVILLIRFVQSFVVASLKQFGARLLF
ncbi:YggT family protein [Candidatus Magnetomonas plexicatena]|uniref:YggT family protein n=1 Tax=Candidatus Magnetomonas plexicatena TaxID=2552947 RepID=UPI001C7402AD|nr:YggT family protein [Nitrospirales bacterium LBB_01]